MTDKLREAAQQAEREAFERALAAKPDARFWNAADAMFWAWQARAALAQQDEHCDNCKGSGAVVDMIYPTSDPQDACRAEVPCDECDGTGMVAGSQAHFKCPKCSDTEQQDAQAVPQGYKLVPVEPTPEMRKAAADAWIDCGDRLILNKAAAALRAGIAASPTPPAQRVTLTDEEIDRLWFANASTSIIEPEIRRAAFARAVIEAYERKNAQPKALPAPLEQQGNPYPST